jgi:hypothetical protein
LEPYQAKLTDWGRWFDRFATSSDDVIDAHDLAEVNLRCSLGLADDVDQLFQDSIDLLDEWSQQLIDYISRIYGHFEKNPESFEHSENLFCAIAMVQFVQTALRVRYNISFAEGDYDASDSRNLFLTGVVTGFGGTCVTLPILYAALAQRIGFPIEIGETWEHFYCVWDVDQNSFCFDAAGTGFIKRTHEDYRDFRKVVTPSDEVKNGFLRSRTRRELFASMANQRSNCLQDQFRFEEALEAAFLATRLAPAIQHLFVSHGVVHYTFQLFRLLGGVPSRWMLWQVDKFANDPQSRLVGPDADRFCVAAAANLKRILKNRFSAPEQTVQDYVFAEFADIT